MIIIESRGQLGNQLFQYAFAYSIAKKLNTFFAIDKRDTKDKLYYFTLKSSQKYFKTRFSTTLYRLKLFLPNSLYLITLKLLKILTNTNKIAFEDDCWSEPNFLLTKVTNNRIYQGFFQSQSYFEDSIEEVKKIFTIKKEYLKEFDEKFKDFFSEHQVLVIHIRRGDYQSLANDNLGGQDLTLPLEYYKNALKKIENLDEYQVLFVGDDLEFAKKSFGQRTNYHFYQNSEIIDFQLIKSADIAILANSSFAWWASFLNAKKHKKILVPQYWVGFKVKKEFPTNIIPMDWEKISF